MYAVGKPVKMTDIDNFTTTHYHIKEEYAVDKAKSVEQVDLLLLFFIEQDAISYRCFFVRFHRQYFVYPWLFFITQFFPHFLSDIFIVENPFFLRPTKRKNQASTFFVTDEVFKNFFSIYYFSYLKGDARTAAEEEEIRTREMDLDKVRLHNDRLSRARVRHNNALEKELLSHVSLIQQWYSTFMNCLKFFWKTWIYS